METEEKVMARWSRSEKGKEMEGEKEEDSSQKKR